MVEIGFTPIDTTDPEALAARLRVMAATTSRNAQVTLSAESWRGIAAMLDDAVRYREGRRLGTLLTLSEAEVLGLQAAREAVEDIIATRQAALQAATDRATRRLAWWGVVGLGLAFWVGVALLAGAL